MTDSTEQQELINKINGETAKMPWRELQTFFAAGKAVHVNASLDLIKIATAFAQDDSAKIQSLMASGQLGLVNDEQAKTWLDDDVLTWAVVIRPWVLVQPVL